MANVLHLSKRLVERPELVGPTAVELRNYESAADISRWLELRHRAFARSRPGILQWGPDDFAAEFLSRPWWSPKRLWFAVPHDPFSQSPEVVGTIAVVDRLVGESVVPAVHWLAVLSGWRRRGVGRALLLALEQYCWDQGHREVFLETHATWNAAGHLYAERGYLPLAEMPNDALT